jgi:hypothetical protein
MLILSFFYSGFLSFSIATAGTQSVYKTEICRTHMATGHCDYGASCQFAHGIEELRPRHFDAKFKTELCTNYHKDGACMFGSRCKFIHDEYRIQGEDNEFWLVSPSENLIRVEMVDRNDTARRAQLQALVNNPPQLKSGASAASLHHSLSGNEHLDFIHENMFGDVFL